MVSIKDFFKTGATISDIEQIIAELKIVDDSQHATIRELKSTDYKILTHVKRLQEENAELKQRIKDIEKNSELNERIKTLEDKLFSLKIVANTSELAIEGSVKNLAEPKVANGYDRIEKTVEEPKN